MDTLDSFLFKFENEYFFKKKRTTNIVSFLRKAKKIRNDFKGDLISRESKYGKIFLKLKKMKT